MKVTFCNSDPIFYWIHVDLGCITFLKKELINSIVWSLMRMESQTDVRFEGVGWRTKE